MIAFVTISRRRFLHSFCAMNVAVILVVAAVASCKARKQSEAEVKVNTIDPNAPAIDMNDLSYMFVRNSVGQIYPFIPVSRSWAAIMKQQGRLDSIESAMSDLPIMTAKIYNDVLAATENQTNFTPPNPGIGYKVIKTPFIGNAAMDVRKKDFDYDNMVVTSFRIDPCAPSLALDVNRTMYQGPSPYWTGNNGVNYAQGVIKSIADEVTKLRLPFQVNACQTQIRLIIQPADATFKVIGESTIHMVYTINNVPKYAQPNGIMHPLLVQAVLELKRDLQEATQIETTGLMLQEHPGLKYEAIKNSNHLMPGRGAKVIVKFLQNYIGSYQNSQVMAIIREANSSLDKDIASNVTTDVILGGGTTADGRYQPGPLVSGTVDPSDGGKSIKGFIMTSSAARGSWKIAPYPERNQPINMGDFNNADLDNAVNPENTILTKLMNADNPETTHFFGNDCITCHGSSQLLREMADKSIAQNNSRRYQVPAGVAGFPIGSYLPDSPKKSGGIMLRNFGYSRNRPIIGLRTVTETAALVDYFNHDLLGVANPGADCITPQGGLLEKQIWAQTMNIGLKPEYGKAEEYVLDLDMLRMSRKAKEDSIFANCFKTTKVPAGTRSGPPLVRPLLSKRPPAEAQSAVPPNVSASQAAPTNALATATGTPDFNTALSNFHKLGDLTRAYYGTPEAALINRKAALESIDGMSFSWDKRKVGLVLEHRLVQAVEGNFLAMGGDRLSIDIVSDGKSISDANTTRLRESIIQAYKYAEAGMTAWAAIEKK